ncbi:hypothetical protein [Pseudomonas kuykendallii]|uniref:hypothetical protein n=1 Tax=Pseudomonas kuykendallii TaxID=1007099 RepID=UPI0028D681D7|nr:hypothetical protein [Pseudomonas kuykendallii]
MRMHRIAVLTLAGLFATAAFADNTGPTHPDSGVRSPLDSKDHQQGVYPEPGVDTQDGSPSAPGVDPQDADRTSPSLPGKSGSDDNGPIPSVDQDGSRATGS